MWMSKGGSDTRSLGWKAISLLWINESSTDYRLFTRTLPLPLNSMYHRQKYSTIIYKCIDLMIRIIDDFCYILIHESYIMKCSRPCMTWKSWILQRNLRSRRVKTLKGVQFPHSFLRISFTLIVHWTIMAVNIRKLDSGILMRCLDYPSRRLCSY
jgi:hypothetical protein